MIIPIFQQPEKDWNSWDDSPRTVEEHIEAYRTNKSKLIQTPVTPEPESIINYFEDMTPKIIRQKKILVPTSDSSASVSSMHHNTGFSRLEATSDIPIIADLEDWEENEQTGWDEINDNNTKLLIREKRREMRAQRQHKSNKTGSQA